MIKFFTWLSVLLGPDPSSNKNKAQKNLQVARFANFHSQLSINWIKCSPSNLRIKCGVFLTSQKGRLFTFFVRCKNFALYHDKRLLRADPCCCSVIKEFAHDFSCTYIELWMHLGSLESAHFSCPLNFPRTFITRYGHAKHDQILNLKCP